MHETKTALYSTSLIRTGLVNYLTTVGYLLEVFQTGLVNYWEESVHWWLRLESHRELAKSSMHCYSNPGRFHFLCEFSYVVKRQYSGCECYLKYLQVGDSL